MIDYYIGVDGGGTGTRIRITGNSGELLTQAFAGPAGLALGVGAAWAAVSNGVSTAFTQLGMECIPLTACAIGLGLAGVHNKDWARQFEQANPGYRYLALASDGYTTLLGAHEGRPGAIVAVGTGSVGQALTADGRLVEAGGWGFPSGDEAGGAWMGLQAVAHMQKVFDARVPMDAFARELIDTCGGDRDAIQAWLASANQTRFASLAPLVLKHAASDAHARAIVTTAGEEIALLASALDPEGSLPLALCGGLGQALTGWLPDRLRRRCGTPRGDSADGALRLIHRHLKEGASHASAA